MNDEQQDFPVSGRTEIRHRIGETGQLILNCTAGSVDVRGDDSTEAVVIARPEHGSGAQLPLSVRKADGMLQVGTAEKGSLAAIAGWFARREGIDFRVTVPRAARVTINTVSADVQAASLSGDQTYKSVSGDVDLRPDGGRIRVTSVSGDVQVRSKGAVEINVSSTSGDVRVRGDKLTAFDARTVSGDVDLGGGLAAGPLHSVETVSGDLSVDATGGVTVDVGRGLDFGGGPRTLVAGDGSAELRFRSLSGDVRVAGARRSDKRHKGLARHERAAERMERHAAQRARRFAERARAFADTTAAQFMDGFGGSDEPAAAPAAPTAPTAPDAPEEQLDVLRALERGEIDVDEAARRLQEA